MNIGDQAFKAPYLRPDLPILSRPMPSRPVPSPALPQNSSGASTSSLILTKFSKIKKFNQNHPLWEIIS